MSNEDLLDAIGDLEGRLSTANLGDNLFKVRVKRKHGGKRSGFRTVIVYKKNDRAIFLYGFGKNKRDNIDKTELRYLKKLAGDLLALNSEQLNRSIERKILFDIDMTEDAK
ncbi:MAG: hypothetical protein B6245_12870 [Desulfobacteraceae bacterium 4572_88]|nr:MAG: hypothetical protein B6245_12870 [Desulfobacteraceae bacterium 4572_88]